ncbi:hypothetical protein [Bradyrhizobium sp. OK095]|uniref:hypothetical protein n=1 Tax=Bradyrhizobium sp. OK095 TaxID=1882760 RepID=UPI001FCD2D73|nr:hypothetical protein [Bradyrhizobium sp. OK095]
MREGVRLIQNREARLAALDAAIARGLDDADANRVRSAPKSLTGWNEMSRQDGVIAVIIAEAEADYSASHVAPRNQGFRGSSSKKSLCLGSCRSRSSAGAVGRPAS